MVITWKEQSSCEVASLVAEDYFRFGMDECMNRDRRVEP